MKVSSNKKTRKNNLPFRILAVALLLFVLLGLSYNLFPSNSEQGEVYFCDMERTFGDKFRGSKGTFTNARNQSKERSRSGNYSAKCGKEYQYGPAVDFDKVNSGDVFLMQVWRFSEEGMGAMVIAGDWGLYKSINKVKTRKNGWDLIEAKLRIPIGVTNQKLKVYVYRSTKEGNIYFDDFKVTRSRDSFKPPEKSKFQEDNLNLIIEDKGIEKLQAKRIDAFAYGNLIAGSDDFVQGKLKTNKTEMLVDARLKGDLLDHLQGKKWSFRIVPEKGKGWKGFKEFSVQNAASRAFLDEWLFHKVLEREGLMTTRYDFIKFSLNDDLLGIYAYEEHFGNPILEHNGRLPGPIFRISEDGLWSNTQKALGTELRWYESAQIEPFDKANVLKSKKLAAMYDAGQNLLHGFMDGDKKAIEVFDLEKFAKFLAVVDLCRANHSTNSTNLRFYYNPATAKLEPIGYDGYSDEGRKWIKVPSIFGKEVNGNIPKVDFVKKSQHFYYYLLNDYDFMAAYGKYLDRFSTEDYVQLLQDTLYPEVVARENFIQQEFPGYKLDLADYFANAHGIRTILYPITDVSLKAYYKERSSSGSILTLEGFHYLPLEIVGTGDKEIMHRPSSKLIVEAFNPDYVGPTQEWKVPGKPKRIFFKTLGTDSIASIEIFRWRSPVPTPPKAVASLGQLRQFDFVFIDENEKVIQIKPGNHDLKTDLNIPKGYILKIAAGTTLNFNKNSAIISNSPIFALGTKANPILLTSSDKMGAGIAVTQTSEASRLEHVYVNDLNSIQKNGVYLDGAVNFYEADVVMENCYFSNLKGKDGLSISRSKYDLSQVRFEYCSGDGFDANYSSGKVSDGFFSHIGKDAIEISGGKLTSNKIAIKNSLRTGLNGNLNAQIEVNTLDISNSERGISSIDQATISIGKLTLNEIKQGLVIYKKQAEYEVGKITIKDYIAQKVDKLHSVETGGELLLKGKIIKD